MDGDLFCGLHGRVVLPRDIGRFAFHRMPGGLWMCGATARPHLPEVRIETPSFEIGKDCHRDVRGEVELRLWHVTFHRNSEQLHSPAIMETIKKYIEIERPVHMVYNQWTQFEDFPYFMQGVKSVKQLDYRRLHWEAEIAGKTKIWTAEIIEQIPDERIAWLSTSGAMNYGQIEFESIGGNCTIVKLILTYEPEGAVEKTGIFFGILETRVCGDLFRFKEFIEERDYPSGSWRGEIEADEFLRKSQMTPS